MKTSHTDLTTWHHCLGHLNANAVTLMLKKNMVTGMEITDNSPLTTSCEPCIKGCIFLDVYSQLPIKSHEGFKYFVTWVDDKSCKVFVTGLWEKSEVTCHLKAFISQAEVKTGQHVSALCSNGGGEYISGKVQCYLKEKGIKHEIIMPDTPQHNGMAKHMNQTLLDKVQAMLIDADLPQSYWYDALRYATHIHNILPTHALDDITPEEAWSSNKPDVSNLQTFRAQAFVHIPESYHDKLSSCSLVCTFLELMCQWKAYRLVHRPTCKFLESRNVIFNERGGSSRFECIIIKNNSGSTRQTPIGQTSITPTAPTPIITTPAPAPPQPPQPLITTPTPTIAFTCPKHNVQAPISDDNPHYSITSYGLHSHTTERASIACANTTKDPKTFAKAMA